MTESVGDQSPDVQRVSAQPAEWLELYGDYLYRYAVSRVFTSPIAEDLVQETLIAGIKSFQKFSQRSSLKSWLTGIIKHKILDYFRKVSRELPGSWGTMSMVVGLTRMGIGIVKLMLPVWIGSRIRVRSLSRKSSGESCRVA